MMAYIFLVIFLGVTGFLVYKEKTGAILCLLTLFPEVVGIMLNRAGLMGLNMAIKYALFACVLWSSRFIINENWQNLWRNPLSVLFYVLIAVMIWHNEIYIGGAKLNPDIANFQLNIILRVLIPYIILMLCADQTDILDDYCQSIPWWGLFLLISIVMLMGFSSIDISDRMSILEETGINTISLSRYAAITLLGSLISLMRFKIKILRYSYSGILIFALFMLLLASQRGTIIGVAVASVLALGFILIRQGRTKEFIYITIGIVSIVLVLLTFFNFEILNRFQQLEGYQSFERYDDYGIAWRAFNENHYLTGLGSMGYQAYTGGSRPYPHSMILELMAEYGIVGLFFAISVIIYGGWMTYKILISYKDTNIEMSIPIIWVSLLFSVLVSGSFLTNASFFLITGVLILCYQNRPFTELEDDDNIEGGSINW